MGVGTVPLIREIDKDATIKEAKHYLLHDFIYNLRISGNHRTYLSSPRLDPTGVSGGGGHNYTEDKILTDTDAGICVKAVNDAINDCTHLYSMILHDHFVRKCSTDRLQRRLGYSESQYFRLQKEALYEFAQRLKYWNKRDHADCPQLIVYKDDENTPETALQ